MGRCWLNCVRRVTSRFVPLGKWATTASCCAAFGACSTRSPGNTSKRSAGACANADCEAKIAANRVVRNRVISSPHPTTIPNRRHKLNEIHDHPSEFGILPWALRDSTPAGVERRSGSEIAAKHQVNRAAQPNRSPHKKTSGRFDYADYATYVSVSNEVGDVRGKL